MFANPLSFRRRQVQSGMSGGSRSASPAFDDGAQLLWCNRHKRLVDDPQQSVVLVVQREADTARVNFQATLEFHIVEVVFIDQQIAGKRITQI
ncbi:hypothetical protein D3C85_1341990 [compost metagenome]